LATRGNQPVAHRLTSRARSDDEPTRAFAWFFGATGAGKRHTIEAVVANPAHRLRREMDLPEPIVALRLSLDGLNRPLTDDLFPEFPRLIFVCDRAVARIVLRMRLSS
jgi:hypothetical protein